MNFVSLDQQPAGINVQIFFFMHPAKPPVEPAKSQNLANTAYGLIIFVIVGYLMHVGQALVIPVIFAIIISFLLYPVCLFFERWKFPRVLAIVTSLLLVTGLLVAIGMVFSTEFVKLFSDMEMFKTRIIDMFNRLWEIVRINFPFVEDNLDQISREGSTQLLSASQSMLGNTLVTSTVFLGYVGIVIIYVFLFLLYRSAFKEFIVQRFAPQRQLKIRRMLYHFQQVIQSYFTGVLIAILLLGAINSIGLYFIGIEHALLFGFFAALLSIVPYVGTTIGGMLPFLYALLNYDEIWRAVAVVIFYQTVQTVEGNFITPKIVGSKVSINPLIAIAGLIAGGFYWGVAGMILAIPIAAILKVVFDNVEGLEPYGVLLSSEFSGAPEPRSKLTLVQRWKKLMGKN